MKANPVSLGLMACLLMGGIARADVIYTYSINLPGISDTGVENDGSTTAYPFTWEGALMFNAPANSDCPTVCGPPLGTTINPNYFFAGFTFTADLALSDSEVEVAFDQFADHSKQIVFTFVEPDSFWSTTGTAIAFPSVAGTPSFTFLGGTATDCAGCTIDISEAGTTATPEPRLSILLVGIVGVFGLALQRRRRQCL